MFLIWLPSAYAELYKYVDENGVIFYTDDYSKILASDRESMEVIEEIEDPEEEGIPVEGKDTSQKKDIQKEDSAKSLDAIGDELDQIKKELGEEYKTLNLEKKKLAQENEDAETEEEKLQSQESIKALNNSIKLYTEKRKTYQKRAEEFNNRIKDNN
ncbi:MAG: DUF4124 domain-containing protein [Desulfobacteraceae bacterium]|nr:DUF4124 domain-containing protein [Desulfobacteraceae bacterium]